MAMGFTYIYNLRSILVKTPSVISLPTFFTARTCYVYKDPNYKTIPSTNHFKSKHYKPEYKKQRKLKVIKIELPDLNENNIDALTQDQIRKKMKERGVMPVRYWMEKPLYIASTSGTFDPYVPPEGDGKISVTSKAGAKQKIEFIGQKGKSTMAVRKIRQFDEDFDPKLLAQEAQQIYVDTHNSLTNFNKVRLHELVTEHAYPLVTHQSRDCTIRWQFLGSLEPPYVVHVRCSEVISPENIFAQVTVRFHTKQTLAIYDRFGRLQHGSEVVAKDVLEYVVFEKHVANTYGVWRIHDKIIPDWMPPRQPILRTFRKKEPEPDVVTTPPVENKTENAVTVN